MSNLANKNILLCVTGGIAAYKAAELVRLFKTANASVRVLMTQGAQEFITPLTMQALSGDKVHTDLLSTEAEAAMGHIELAKWSDLIVVAPCSANSLSKLAEGRGDDLFSAVCLASESDLFVAPAMNQAMWKDMRTQKNLKRIIKFGAKIIGPASGEQACGDIGEGRMTEPKDIFSEIENEIECGLLTGRKVLITAGPTQEMIDPVRFISNKSSGKMGFSLAEEIKNQGAIVTLISGPVNLKTPDKVKRFDVQSAKEMQSKVEELIEDYDIFISAAAVADFKPKKYEQKKIKKGSKVGQMKIELDKNFDILKTVTDKKLNLKTIGFAAETDDLINNAEKKLVEKNLDLIVANDVSDQSIGFDSDENEVTLITKLEKKVIKKTSKKNVSKKIVEFIAQKVIND
ncbi:MAG: bifunctional phosphopantothenoylcysteine decarboxylase/phosphopantothenate--cysteine ligase CoaBC [Pseudomonadota bacterium]|jgi:phosphopantothenoylcysteine decarboxylase/phosphopantothenate--cysteine ligase|nr:bifunctional phosphopantothenoylcysteine decarboxylase/phosphopantothenate--cysteine ligase CoaBC [Pseudomonadota bacterium]MEC7787553.1 bifunctional phosphopantothenoylcysteine decarboxylase/phosphopantothenate--cysteine ligase CoaBC [Pseudomonadota bacterium]MEC8108239.1 bifunctional phosphopantothenoylcysteine decarboxylase/phosphopantothenate--cysteine ligase CoaBC [Pseudomonadota bacterium]MEC8169303.1 bifunctional phosphopantothenoylcysteine decarboxylase/phosphopantothenate--cysteine l|tara:strand:- start:1703 stop:2908 length:1206 start_codon:yes stop_codon:yes gene_type:complete